VVRRALWTTLAVLAVAVVAASPVAAAPDRSVQLTQVGRLPFPDRGFVVDLPTGTAVQPSAIRVLENGRPVQKLQVLPVGDAGIHFGVVLAVDASDSMAGKPIRAALGAARAFVAHQQGSEEIALLVFNTNVHVLEAPTLDSTALGGALAKPPTLAYGTHIYDALGQALTLLDGAKISAGSIVLLSDGADIGSSLTAKDVIAKAQARHVRVFTVGLRSPAFAAGPLQALAARTGGSYAEASSTARLAAIYDSLGKRLASEYLVRYRSDALPHSHVEVLVTVQKVGSASAPYTAPTPSGLAPFHRSLFSRFVMSSAAVASVGLIVALLTALAILGFIQPRESRTVVDRITDFAGRPNRLGIVPRERVRRKLALGLESFGWFAKLENSLDVARIEMSATRVVALTAAGTVLAMILLGLLAAPFVVLGLLTPLIPRALIARKRRKLQEEFAEQLAPNLQVLASAMRVGHSFTGALAVVTDNAHEPSHSELRRVLTDEQLGVPVDEAVNRIAERMSSRDLEQVALLAELQRTAGGNAAEVLDTVIRTIRERGDVRRLIKTLTAQGRMARWILTALPILAGLGMWLVQRDLMRPLLTTSGGQIAIVVAACMVTAGSLVIQKIVDINV
jgi:tight adherence protein B